MPSKPKLFVIYEHLFKKNTFCSLLFCHLATNTPLMLNYSKYSNLRTIKGTQRVNFNFSYFSRSAVNYVTEFDSSWDSLVTGVEANFKDFSWGMDIQSCVEIG